VSTFRNNGYERIERDDYQTIDPRCLQALEEAAGRMLPKWWTDPCVDENGRSSLVEQRPGLFNGYGKPRSIVTNPPYETKTLARLMRDWLYQLQLDSEPIDAVAILVRSDWDHAAGRAHLFSMPEFAGSVRMQFRPYWFADGDATPQHCFQWLIWKANHVAPPVTMYAGAGWEKPELNPEKRKTMKKSVDIQIDMWDKRA